MLNAHTLQPVICKIIKTTETLKENVQSCLYVVYDSTFQMLYIQYFQHVYHTKCAQTYLDVVFKCITQK